MRINSTLPSSFFTQYGSGTFAELLQNGAYRGGEQRPLREGYALTYGRLRGGAESRRRERDFVLDGISRGGENERYRSNLLLKFKGVGMVEALVNH